MPAEGHKFPGWRRATLVLGASLPLGPARCPQPRGGGGGSLSGPTCHTVGSQFTSLSLTRTVGPGRLGRRGQARRDSVRRPARRQEEVRPGSLPLGAQAGHLVWIRPHLLENLQRGERRVSAVALATALSHCNEPGSGRRLFLKEHKANRLPASQVSRSWAPSRGSGLSSTRRTAGGVGGALGPAVPADEQSSARWLCTHWATS